MIFKLVFYTRKVKRINSEKCVLGCQRQHDLWTKTLQKIVLYRKIVGSEQNRTIRSSRKESTAEKNSKSSEAM